MPYRAHRRLVAPAEARPALWRVAAGLCLALAVAFGLSQALLGLLREALPAERSFDLAAAMQTGDSPAAMLLVLALTGTLGVGAAVAARLLHARSGWSLIGPAPLAVRQGLRVLAAVAALQIAVAVLPPWPLASTLEPALAPGAWAALLPVTLVVLLLQTGAEEVLFRGYLQSQLAARLRHPVVWLAGPSVLFGLAHLAPGTYGDNAWLVVAWAFAFGLAAADLTARAGTLGPAIALHFVNNAGAVALVAPQGSLDGLALYRLPFGPDDPALAALMPLELGVLGLSWLAARLSLRA